MHKNNNNNVLNWNITLKDVPLVPKVELDLISISKAAQNDCKVIFEDNACKIMHNDEAFSDGKLNKNLSEINAC